MLDSVEKWCTIAGLKMEGDMCQRCRWLLEAKGNLGLMQVLQLKRTGFCQQLQWTSEQDLPQGFPIEAQVDSHLDVSCLRLREPRKGPSDFWDGEQWGDQWCCFKLLNFTQLAAQEQSCVSSGKSHDYSWCFFPCFKITYRKEIAYKSNNYK